MKLVVDCAPMSYVRQSPIQVSWDVTSLCNLRCGHCYSGLDASEGSSDLSTKEARRLIRMLREEGVFSVVLLGGEPLLRPDTLDLIADARAAGLEVALSTNGTLVTRGIAKVLGRLHLDGVQVSIDAACEEVHDRFRGVQGTWAKAVRAVSLLAEEGVQTIVATVVMSFNFRDLPSIARLAARHGAEEFRTLRLIPVGRGSDLADQMISPAQARTTARTLKLLRDELKGDIDVRLDESFGFLNVGTRHSEFCTAGTSTCAIRANGDVVPCSFLAGPEFVVGNVRTSELGSIWRDSDAMRTFRDEPLIGGPCAACEHVKLCLGGCRAAAWNKAHSHRAPDPYCWIAEEPGSALADQCAEVPIEARKEGEDWHGRHGTPA